MSRMSPELLRKYFGILLAVVAARFGSTLLNLEPITEELRGIVRNNEASGFSGCIVCLDCMRIKWKNCVRIMKGQYHNLNEGKLENISAQALCESYLYYWYWYFGCWGANNYITVLDNSPFINNILSNWCRMTLPEIYCLNERVRVRQLYVLIDGICPNWSTFAVPTHATANERDSHMKKRHGSVRNDLERFFECLQGRFHILRQ